MLPLVKRKSHCQINPFHLPLSRHPHHHQYIPTDVPTSSILLLLLPFLLSSKIRGTILGVPCHEVQSISTTKQNLKSKHVSNSFHLESHLKGRTINHPLSFPSLTCSTSNLPSHTAKPLHSSSHSNLRIDTGGTCNSLDAPSPDHLPIMTSHFSKWPHLKEVFSIQSSLSRFFSSSYHHSFPLTLSLPQR